MTLRIVALLAKTELEPHDPSACEDETELSVKWT